MANGPYTIAVNADFANEFPGIIVGYLRASIRAGRWINQHPAAAAEIFTRVTFNQDAKLVEQLLAGLDFVPNLSPKNLTAIDIQRSSFWSTATSRTTSTFGIGPIRATSSAPFPRRDDARRSLLRPALQPLDGVAGPGAAPRRVGAARGPARRRRSRAARAELRAQGLRPPDEVGGARGPISRSAFSEPRSAF